MTTAALERALDSCERPLLDSSTPTSNHSPFEMTHPLTRHLLRRVQADDDPVRATIFTVSVVELLVRPLRTGQEAFTNTFLIELPGQTVAPMDMEVAGLAATLRAPMGLVLPEAVVIATGMPAGYEAIVGTMPAGSSAAPPLSPQFRWRHRGAFM